MVIYYGLMVIYYALVVLYYSLKAGWMPRDA